MFIVYILTIKFIKINKWTWKPNLSEEVNYT